MKRNKVKQKSFIGYCVFYFSLYSCILIFSIIGIHVLIEKRLDRVLPTMDDFLTYSNYLEEDAFSKIPLNKFKNNDIIIFDENNNEIFATKNKYQGYISVDDLQFINCYYDNFYYTVKEIVRDDGNLYYFISKNYNDDGYFTKIDDYALLDKDLNIIKGDAFGKKKGLSKRELYLLEGFVGDHGLIEKYNYQTKGKEKRTLIFFTPPFDEDHYSEQVGQIYTLWLYLVPIVAILELGLVYCFFIKIKKMVMPLKKMVDDYTTLAVIDEQSVPKEFKELCASFKRLLAKLNKEKEKREIIYKEKQSIIANISHDLKTPLTVILGYAKAFKDQMVSKEKHNQYIDAVYNKSVIAVRIIDSLFEYTQMEHPDFKACFEVKDFNQFCKEYLLVKYTDLELQGYRLEFHLLNKELKRNFDSNLMTRLFDNIIHNSVKYNQKGTTIYFRLIYRNNKLKIIFADDGKGIDKEIQQGLFSPFVMGDEARSSGSGTGLGLYIAKRVVEIHNGTIKLVTKPKRPYHFEIDVLL